MRAGTGLTAGDAGAEAATAGRTTGDTVRAYIALTKPRIIELLLVTTVPAMVLATRDLPGAGAGVDWADWGVPRLLDDDRRHAGGRAAPTPSTATSIATSTCS